MECVCPILDRPTTADATAFGRGAWSLVRCRQTGFVFLANPPAYSRLASEFAWEKTSQEERHRRQAAEPVLSRVSALAKAAKIRTFPNRNRIASLAVSVFRSDQREKPLHVLDIGCGWGHLMVDLHQRFAGRGQRIVPWGIEVSPRLAAITADRVAAFGGKVLCQNALDGLSELEPKSIHLAVMSSFLEHECRPLSLLKQLHSVLTSDGAVVLKVPNFACWNRFIRQGRWCGFRYPDHVNYFTPRTLQRLAREAGFAGCRQRFRDRFPLSDNMYAVLKKA